MAAIRKRNLGGIMLLGFLLLSGGCAGSGELPVLSESIKEQQDIAVVEQGNLQYVEYYSLTSVPETAEVITEDSAYIKRWNASLGDRVKQGDVIAVLEYEEQEGQAPEEVSSTINYELEQLKLDLELAKAIYQSMLEKKSSREELRLQQIEIELLELDVKRLSGTYTEEDTSEETSQTEEKKASVLEITAPFDGVVAYCTAAVEGDFVPAMSCIAVVAGENTVLQGEYLSEKDLSVIDRMYAVIDGIETELVKLPYTAEDFAQECARFEAEGTSVAAGRTIGAYLVSNTREDVCYVPINALQADGDGYFLYVITATEEDGTVKREKRKVEIGLLTMSFAEIVSGVRKGEKVLVTE